MSDRAEVTEHKGMFAVRRGGSWITHTNNEESAERLAAELNGEVTRPGRRRRTQATAEGEP